MIVAKNLKKKKYQNLTLKFKQLNRETQKQNCDFSRVHNLRKEGHDFKNQYVKAQQKISTESEIKNQLEQEITRSKKSLNLLKGDIRHLVSRNQSTSLIQSKTSKVKIVADDQLQQVSMAFFKDKNQLKIKADMQKRFKRNLRNVSMLQNSALKKYRSHYVEMIMKKKQINDRLNHIEKVSSLINQSVIIQKIKNQNNYRVIQLYSCFLKIINLISQTNGTQKKYDNVAIQNSSQLEQINKEKLLQFQEIIVTEFQRINRQIYKKTIIYDLEMEKHNMLVLKLQSFQKQIQIHNQQFFHEESFKFDIKKETIQQYKNKLKKFNKKLKVIFVFLEFIDKFNTNFNHQKPKPKTIPNASQFFVAKDSSNNKSSFQYLNAKIFSNKDIKQNKKSPTQSLINKNYISQLLIVYQTLRKINQNQNLDLINPNIFSLIQNNLQKWFQILKQKYTKKNLLMIPQIKKQQKPQNLLKPRRSTSRLRQSRISVFVLPKTTKLLQDDQKIQIIEENKFHNQMHKLFQLKKRQNSVKQYRPVNSFHVWQQKNNSKSKHQLSKTSQNSVYGSTLIDQQKLKHNTQHLDHNQVKRFNYLYKIDRDYYKMLKSTLKMQIQNTKKNYIFSKDFKRDKYSPRNEILQQRRFQCNFSIAFAKNSNEALKKSFNENKKSSFFKHSNFQKRISKINDINSSFENIKMSNVQNSRMSNLSQRRLKLSLQKDKSSLKVSKSVMLKKKFNQELKQVINLI